MRLRRSGHACPDFPRVPPEKTVAGFQTGEGVLLGKDAPW
jgi:hypothetical protein